MHLEMTPAPGSVLRRHVGDRLCVELYAPDAPEGCQAWLRTDLGHARESRQAVIDAIEGNPVHQLAAWHSLPLQALGEGRFRCELTLTECALAMGKAFLITPDGVRHWPEGGDFTLTIHPADLRSANTLYCAFPRLFHGSGQGAVQDKVFDDLLRTLDKHGYAVIPPSGTLRDLSKAVPHIVERLGCRWLHLLPIGPVPTTFARYGRYGSPYASLDLAGIDPALIVHDRRTTPEDQFRELADACHQRGARMLLDLAINHTGWGSREQNSHPEWYLRDNNGHFVSPGAWGTTWEDLAELDFADHALWRYLADVLLTWCRRGVDGFRADAGYKIPIPVWRYLVARVQQAFPDVVFLLEGLGGPWDTTETLLGRVGMQWAYSELFQNYDHAAITGYLRYALGRSESHGVWVHYSETHDNLRLAAQGRDWSLFRNRLCALTSVQGAFGYTCGVEWLATEKILVHGNTSMNWGASDNLCAELKELAQLLRDEPCFHDGAQLVLHDHPHVVLLERRHGQRRALVLINPDQGHSHTVLLPQALGLGQLRDALGQTLDTVQYRSDGACSLIIGPLTCWCLVPEAQQPIDGAQQRRLRAAHGWAVQLLGSVLAPNRLPHDEWQDLANLAWNNPLGFAAAATRCRGRQDVSVQLLTTLAQGATTSCLSVWAESDQSRVLPIPAHHILLVRHDQPFRVRLTGADSSARFRRSVATAQGHVATFTPVDLVTASSLELEDTVRGKTLRGGLCVLDPWRVGPTTISQTSTLLLSNGRGAMAWIPAVPSEITSKYHCLLAANLHPTVPVDRQVLVKRLRLWLEIGGFTVPLDGRNLNSVLAGPPAQWEWVVRWAPGQECRLALSADFLHERNGLVLRFRHTPADTPPTARMIVRLDLEDRNFHAETSLADNVAVNHFRQHTRPLGHGRGFLFQVTGDRRLEAWVDHGSFHMGEEILRDIPHPHEAQRGHRDRGDAWSPGHFAIPLDQSLSACLVLCADALTPTTKEYSDCETQRLHQQAVALDRGFAHDWLGQTLTLATQAYVVRREQGCTVIAGYPWFLDWGRDTLICARGLLTAGMYQEVRGLLSVFGRFEEGGTLPNAIYGTDARNRETSDAPLWYGAVVDDCALTIGIGPKIYDQAVSGTRTVRDVLTSIAVGYWRGTSVGVRADHHSGLIWSPAHFTWMDTNHPAGTPRAGYPIEIQALWLHLLRQLDRIAAPQPSDMPSWSSIAQQVEHNLERYWLPEQGFFADCLHAPHGESAAQARRDDALRPNMLIAIALGVLGGERAQRAVAAARDWLIIPGGVRSLAPLPLQAVPLEIRDAGGKLLANPQAPYVGRYGGDEDSKRKPAYHNGTAWGWPYPIFCEAFARAFAMSPEAVHAARAYLSAVGDLLHEGCAGHLPEILDGDAPHHQRGCLAQAWSVTEALRVWKLLGAVNA